MKKILVSGMLAVVFGVACVSQVMAQSNENEKIIGQYIVVLKDGVDVDETADEIIKKQGLGHLFTYKNTLKGFAAKNISEDKLEKIKNDPRVKYVAEDKVASIDAKPTKPIVSVAEKFQPV